MKLPRVRFTIRRLMVVVAAVAFLMAVATYRPFVDGLQSPVAVKGWSDKGVLLADGRTVTLPGIRMLPTSSAALTEATRRGVELARGGRVYGLVRVHHWCGNDRVRDHIARVDLSHLLAFVGEGAVVRQLDPELRVRMAEKPGGRFTAAGWEIGEFYQFQGWCRRADEAGSHSRQAGPSMVPAAANANLAGKAGRSVL